MLRQHGTASPRVATSAYVDASAQVVGDVDIGDESSVWLNAVVRGDVNRIRIGARSNLQDGVIVHVNRDPSHPTLVGDDVTVGHGAILHGCTVENLCLIGMGAILLNGCRIGSGSIVAAGTLVTERVEVPAGSLVMGSPGRVRRSLTEAERALIAESAANYVRYRLAYLPNA
jgi:carbonic anhydrase/acetyltransferase-like protein (isoleucine patch superfamily)